MVLFTMMAILLLCTQHGSCITPSGGTLQGGAGVFWRHKDPQNVSLRLPGPATNNRAELYAALWAVVYAPPRQHLHIIVTDSTYVIHSACHWAAVCVSQGWSCYSDDILKDLVKVIAARPTATSFQWVKAHSKNQYNDAVDLQAKEGAMLVPHIAAYSSPPYRQHDVSQCTPIPNMAKVSTTLPPMSVPTPKANLLLPDIELKTSDAHRSRVKVCLMQKSNLQNLLQCNNDKHFWRYPRVT